MLPRKQQVLKREICFLYVPMCLFLMVQHGSFNSFMLLVLPKSPHKVTIEFYECSALKEFMQWELMLD